MIITPCFLTSIRMNLRRLRSKFQYHGLVIALTATMALPALAENLIGQASIIDGDTIEIHGQRIRLFGIDAPESDQLCRSDDSLQYRCGAKAANKLDGLIAGRPVSCISVSTDQYRRVVAVCSVGGQDVAAWLVRGGLAFDWPQYSKGKYAAEQKDADQEGRGVWAGSYVLPWAYRACRRNGGRTSDCSDETMTVRTNGSLLN